MSKCKKRITPQSLKSVGFEESSALSDRYNGNFGDVYIGLDYIRDGKWELSVCKGINFLGKCKYIKYLYQVEIFLSIYGIELWKNEDC